MRWPMTVGDVGRLLTLSVVLVAATVLTAANAEDVTEDEPDPYQTSTGAINVTTTKPPHRGYLPWIPCGQAPLYDKQAASSRIIGGANQRYGQFPSYVRLSIQTSPYSGSFCGGTLISDRHVITAAHCVTSERNQVLPNANVVRVTMGDHEVGRMDPNERSLRASNICVSPHYRRNTQIYHDWAVLTLEQRVNFTDYIQPACLPRAHVSTFGNRSLCWLVGEGHVGFRPGGFISGPTPIDPNVVQVMRVHQVQCRAWNIPGTDRSRMCFTKGAGPGDSCQGDSGGPVFCRDRWKQWNLMAVVSAGTDNCNSQGGLYGLYTNVRRLMRDIEFHCFKPRTRNNYNPPNYRG